MIFDRHANLKYKFGNRHFWSEGYYVSTVGLNEATIKKYIQDQEKYDIMQHPNIELTEDGGAAPYTHHPICIYDARLLKQTLEVINEEEQ